MGRPSVKPACCSIVGLVAHLSRSLVRMNRLAPVSAVLLLSMIAGCASEQPLTGQMFADDSQEPLSRQAGNPVAVGSPDAGPETELVDILVNQLGIDSRQAKGGVGSILALVQQRMDPIDFMRLSNSVPNIDQYLSAVPASTSSISWFSSPESLQGQQGPGSDRQTVLESSFERLGMNADMISRFTSIVLQYVQAQNGPEVMSLLLGALY